MAYGDGSISEIKKKDGRSYSPKRWKVNIYLGVDPITHKKRQVVRNVRGPKSKAREVRDELIESLRQPYPAEIEPEPTEINPDAEVTFKEFSERWHEARVATEAIGESRTATINSLLRCINAHLGPIRIVDVTPQMVEACILEIRREKVAERGSISGTTLHMYHGIIKQVLDHAVKYHIIAANPASMVAAPKCDRPDRRSMSPVGSRRLLSIVAEGEAEAYRARREIEERKAARGDESEPGYLRSLSGISRLIAVRIGLATGVRLGEALALTWGDVDLDRGKIAVRHSITKKLTVKKTKTDGSRRTISIDRETIRSLATWREFQRSELAILTMVQTDLTPVCCNDFGAYLRPDNFDRWWRGFRAEHGLGDLVFHELRHTQASELIANNVDMKTVQRRLGHASFGTTMDIYAHAMPENDDEAARLIGELHSVPEGEEVGDGPLTLVI